MIDFDDLHGHSQSGFEVFAIFIHQRDEGFPTNCSSQVSAGGVWAAPVSWQGSELAGQQFRGKGNEVVFLIGS
jgi:hypothetical protein